MDIQLFRNENISSNFNFNFQPALPTVQKGPPILKVISELEIAKQFANKRPEYIKGLVQYLKHFARGREQKSISEFDTATIESWFTSRTEALTTRASNIGRLSSIFSFAVRRKYIRENPCDFLERVTIERGDPPVLSTEQIEACFEFAIRQPPRFLLWFVLAGIVGIRPGELQKMNAEAIQKNLSEGLLIIDSMISKVRNRRVIELSPHAKTWIDHALSDEIQLPFSKIFMRRCRRKLKQHLGILKWPQDILRHTALSYMLALHGDETRAVDFLLQNG